MTYGGHYCAKCKYDNGKGEDRCGLKGCKIARYALDLINRLQAENERLEEENEKQYEIARDTIRAEIADGETSCHWCEDTIRGVAKAEAYKEVLDIIDQVYNKHIFGDNDLEAEEKDAIINFSDDITSELKNRLEEMAGEDNEPSSM